MERFILFLLGGSAYVGLELAWRGVSHWTMFVAGGLALCLLQALSVRRLPLQAAAGMGALGVTAMELVIGLFCTRILQVSVWDYSAEWANYAGLICPKFTLVWFFLCMWILYVMRLLQSRLFPRRTAAER